MRSIHSTGQGPGDSDDHESFHQKSQQPAGDRFPDDTFPADCGRLVSVEHSLKLFQAVRSLWSECQALSEMETALQRHALSVLDDLREDNSYNAVQDAVIALAGAQCDIPKVLCDLLAEVADPSKRRDLIRIIILSENSWPIIEGELIEDTESRREWIAALKTFPSDTLSSIVDNISDENCPVVTWEDPQRRLLVGGLASAFGSPCLIEVLEKRMKDISAEYCERGSVIEPELNCIETLLGEAVEDVLRGRGAFANGSDEATNYSVRKLPDIVEHALKMSSPSLQYFFASTLATLEGEGQMRAAAVLFNLMRRNQEWRHSSLNEVRVGALNTVLDLVEEGYLHVKVAQKLAKTMTRGTEDIIPDMSSIVVQHFLKERTRIATGEAMVKKMVVQEIESGSKSPRFFGALLACSETGCRSLSVLKDILSTELDPQKVRHVANQISSRKIAIYEPSDDNATWEFVSNKRPLLFYLHQISYAELFNWITAGGTLATNVNTLLDCAVRQATLQEQERWFFQPIRDHCERDAGARLTIAQMAGISAFGESVDPEG